MLEQGQHLCPGQPAAAMQGVIKKPAAALQDSLIQAQLGLAAAGPGEHARCAKLQDPFRILRWHEVDRTAQGPGADDLFSSDGLLDLRQRGGSGAQTDGPHCLGIILGLEGAHPAHDLFGALEFGVQEALVGQPVQYEGRDGHGVDYIPPGPENRKKLIAEMMIGV